jgi:peptidoglycan/LPS O-acetylase OafA/YrhL
VKTCPHRRCHLQRWAAAGLTLSGIACIAAMAAGLGPWQAAAGFFCCCAGAAALFFTACPAAGRDHLPHAWTAADWAELEKELSK